MACDVCPYTTEYRLVVLSEEVPDFKQSIDAAWTMSDELYGNAQDLIPHTIEMIDTDANLPGQDPKAWGMSGRTYCGRPLIYVRRMYDEQGQERPLWQTAWAHELTAHIWPRTFEGTNGMIIENGERIHDPKWTWLEKELETRASNGE